MIALLSALLDNHNCLLRDKQIRIPAPVETEMVYLLKAPYSFPYTVIYCKLYHLTDFADDLNDLIDFLSLFSFDYVFSRHLWQLVFISQGKNSSRSVFLLFLAIVKDWLFLLW